MSFVIPDGTFIVDGSCKILEGDVFVYNLGTMLFVDSVLGSEEQLIELRAVLATAPPTTTLPAAVPESELSEESGTEKDLLVDEGSATQSTTATPETTNMTLESNDIPAVVTTTTVAPEIPQP